MSQKSSTLKQLLSTKAGLSSKIIEAAWPAWWSEDADFSPSAQAELRFTVSRKLGLDPRTLFDDETPAFIWNDSAKYKNFTGDQRTELPAITSFAKSIGRILLNCSPEHYDITNTSAARIRSAILKNKSFISLTDLLAMLWGVGIPVIHLRLYPLPAKRMCAMAISHGPRRAILLAKDAYYPAFTAFHVAHEIGHIVLGHIDPDSAVIDMADPIKYKLTPDLEERQADIFALELLTGNPNFTIVKKGVGHSAQVLAEQSVAIGTDHNIEPGTVALCYGYATNEWATVQKAMTYIYNHSIPVWKVVNKIAFQQIKWDNISDDNAHFLSAILGEVLD